jgi:osmotically-inducible protein OsmY
MSDQKVIEKPRGETDSELQRDVMDELAAQPNVDASQIRVSVKDGIVILSGHVNSYVEKYAAEKAAKRVSGVKAVVNELEVQLLSGNQRTDEDLAFEAIRALRSHILLAPLDIRVTVRNGVVTLEGEVEWQYQKDAAERAIHYLPGLKGIMNLIRVRPRLTPSALKARIEAALRRTAGIDTSRILVEVEGGKVTLIGRVRSLDEKEKAEQVAWSAPGVESVEDLLTVEP